MFTFIALHYLEFISSLTMQLIHTRTYFNVPIILVFVGCTYDCWFCHRNGTGHLAVGGQRICLIWNYLCNLLTVILSMPSPHIALLWTRYPSRCFSRRPAWLTELFATGRQFRQLFTHHINSGKRRRERAKEVFVIYCASNTNYNHTILPRSPKPLTSVRHELAS